jgi:hypothetical protein
MLPDAGQSLLHPGSRPVPPGTLRPTVQWVREGGGARQRSWGQGWGRGFCGMAAAAIVPGGIRQRYRRPDAGSHGPGPAPVRGMAWQPLAPLGHDKGCCCRPATAGPSLRLWPGGASRKATAWGRGVHGTMTPRGVGCVCCAWLLEVVVVAVV